MAGLPEDLLGAGDWLKNTWNSRFFIVSFLWLGLDIDGWSYIKNEVAAKIADMQDRSTILRSMFPLLLKSKFVKENEKRDVYDIVQGALEFKAVLNVPFVGT